MLKIPVITSDSHIWNRDQVICSLIGNQNREQIILDLLYEGPCCKTSGINAIIDWLHIPHDKILIYTSNQIRSSDCKEIVQPLVELEFCQKIGKDIIDFEFTGKKRFACFISRSNAKRLGIAGHLWRYHRDQSLLTYHFDSNNNYHRANFGLEEYLSENWSDAEIWKFLQQLPLTFDKQSYPIQWKNSITELAKHYQDFFVEIVCETYHSGRTFFITEKTWRPILNCKPFVVQGPQWYLENLRRLGFQTFNQWWSEGYDEDINGGTLNSLTNLIDFIGKQPDHVIQQWYHDMKSVLQHNYYNFLQLTQQKINSTLYQIPS